MDYFFTSCHAAGPDICPFYAPTPDLIAANLTKLYETVQARPLPVRTPASYGLVDYTRLRTSVFSSLYSPWATYPTLANALAALAQGDGAPLFSMYDLPKFQCDCSTDSEDSRLGKDAQTTIMCNDGDPISSEFEDLEDYFEDVVKKSEWFELWADIRTRCTDYFVHGTLPPPDTICPVIGTPFFPLDKPTVSDDQQTILGDTYGSRKPALTMKEHAMYDVLKKLSTSYYIQPWH
ncbi:hypothetical protein C0992_013345 [Termitomyces sp. T32_za158]|nr:hypothetical protein C0992_013345 [Termitomyces sp. T32_za158]